VLWSAEGGVLLLETQRSRRRVNSLSQQRSATVPSATVPIFPLLPGVWSEKTAQTTGVREVSRLHPQFICYHYHQVPVTRHQAGGYLHPVSTSTAPSSPPSTCRDWIWSTVPPIYYSLLSPADCDAVMVEKYFTASTRDGDAQWLLWKTAVSADSDEVGTSVVVVVVVAVVVINAQLAVWWQITKSICLFLASRTASDRRTSCCCY